MKKLMLGTALMAVALTVSAPSFAREIKEVVGYVKTETTYSPRDDKFMEMDMNGDGIVDFKEFQRKAMFENNYEMFKMNDTNNDNLLSMEEYRTFSKWGPSRTADGPSMTSYNFNKPGTESR